MQSAFQNQRGSPQYGTAAPYNGQGHGQHTRAISALAVNDVHSKLNRTLQKEVVRVRSEEQVKNLLRCLPKDETVSICGAKHAMGGQQFLSGGILFDTGHYRRIIDFCPTSGLIEVESGILWADLVPAINALSSGKKRWCIVQKPTGADDISVGGSLAANIHGRVLNRKPFVSDIDSLRIIMADGSTLNASRHQNSQLFKLAIGGYGLFGFVSAVTFRLMPVKNFCRSVELMTADALIDRFHQHIKEGAEYGDFQFEIDSSSDHFLTGGILSVYKPTAKDCDGDGKTKRLTPSEWSELISLAHNDKSQAFRKYSRHYLATDGQVYSSDDFQLTTYLAGYHESLHNLKGKGAERSSEMITELYVPRKRLPEFLINAAEALRKQKADVVYGTVRLIERDDETFLPWARQAYACVIFNLHVDHNHSSIERCKRAFRTLIDLALALDGSYYLTYHRYATKDQVLTAYPQMPEFFKEKARFDPDLRFQSEWYKHHIQLLETGS
ncbi:MAG TPA: FAD-binding oxidoreductase [Candidatus Obscuribacterales bacterium]